MIGDIAELRKLDAQHREWRRQCRQRRMVLSARRVPVARQMAVMEREMGLEIRDGETLSEFVARALKGVR
jgi:hypothetical protein